jgi:predicted RNase H-like nuclease (RuvC/YqgF family)
LYERIEELKAENGDLKAHVEYLMTKCHIFTDKRLKELLEQRAIESRIRIDDLERWVKGIADDKQMPTWIQQSARSLLAQEGE